jgi:hypothetical protein
MKHLLSLIAAGGLALGAGSAAAEAAPGGPAFAHAVFFTLVDPSEAARDRLIEACRKYLSGHEGTLHFAVGARDAGMTRDVNVRDFDVSLHIVFDSKAAHDRYQAHPRHAQFRELERDTWKQVRVFDSLLR